VNKIYSETEDKGLAVISIDESATANDATVYLARHHYGWANYHDENKAMESAFQGEGVPLAVLIDARGKIVYYDFGGDEIALRKAIASLGAKFSSVAPSGSDNQPAASHRGGAIKN
jgi:hypothetical protein